MNKIVISMIKLLKIGVYVIDKWFVIILFVIELMVILILKAVILKVEVKVIFFGIYFFVNFIIYSCNLGIFIKVNRFNIKFVNKFRRLLFIKIVMNKKIKDRINKLNIFINEFKGFLFV